MRQIKRYKCRLELQNRVREDEVRCFRITLDMSAFPRVLEQSVFLRRSVGVGQPCLLAPDMRIVAYVELSIWRPVAKSFALSLNRTHWRIRKTSTHRTAHYTETFEMSR